MKKILVDTHAFIWFVNGNDRLSKEAKKAIEDTDIRYLSVASIWEMAIKISIREAGYEHAF